MSTMVENAANFQTIVILKSRQVLETGPRGKAGGVGDWTAWDFVG